MVKIEWEISDKELIQTLIKNFEFEAKNYIDAQLLIFFENNKGEIEKTVKEYINSNEFKTNLLCNVNKHLNFLANEEIF